MADSKRTHNITKDKSRNKSSNSRNNSKSRKNNKNRNGSRKNNISVIKSTKKRCKARKKRHTAVIVLKCILLFIMILILISLIFGIYVYYKYNSKFKEAQQNAYESIKNMDSGDFDEGVNTYFYYNDGSLMGSHINGSYEYVPLSKISEYIKDGYIAVEDKRFYEHNGIDIKGILRAGTAYIKNKGSITQGGSTITQQVVKNNILKDSSKTFERKITEMFAAIELEKMYSKDEILEMYLNSNFYGSNCYGIQAACKYFFGCSAKDVNVSQAAMLIGMSNAPTRYNPERNYDTAIEKRNQVLNIMLLSGTITEEQYDEAVADPLELTLYKESSDLPATYEFTYALKCSVEELMKYKGFDFKYLFNTEEDEKSYISRYNESYAEAKNEILTGGYRIYTSIDKNRQNELLDTLKDELKSYDDSKTEDGRYKLQAAAVSIDNSNNYVIAIAGGREDGEYLNRAYQSARQPGSSIKPVLDYTPAFDILDYHPSTLVEDTPLSGEYQPKNHDGIYRGNISIRTALLNSVNTTAVKTLMNVGMEKSLEYLEEMHFSNISNEDNNNAAIAIGGFTNGVTVEEMTKAYNALADNGEYSDRTCIKTMLHQNEVIRKESDQNIIQVYKKGSAYMMTDCLKANFTEGYVKAYQIENQQCAGKTGTTNDNKDSWLCAYTPYYTTCVWAGYDSPESFNNGAVICGNIWKNFNETLHDGLNEKDFDRPDSVYEHFIDWKGELCDYDSGKKDLFQEEKPAYDTASFCYKKVYDTLQKAESENAYTYETAIKVLKELEAVKTDKEAVTNGLEKEYINKYWNKIYNPIKQKVQDYEYSAEKEKESIREEIRNKKEKETETEIPSKAASDISPAQETQSTETIQSEQQISQQNTWNNSQPQESQKSETAALQN